MKANELMIDDWVMHNNTPKQVSQIWSNKTVSLADKNQTWGSIYTDRYEEDEIEPIPLTPEILEKNEFAKNNTIKSYISFYFPEEVVWDEWNILVVGTRSKFEDIGVTCYKDEYQPTINCLGIKYVHELQHALKLCKIEKEIIL